jgi:hypothetical protein
MNLAAMSHAKVFLSILAADVADGVLLGELDNVRVSDGFLAGFPACRMLAAFTSVMSCARHSVFPIIIIGVGAARIAAPIS